MNAVELDQRRKERLFWEAANGEEEWWWLSFCDNDRPVGSKFLGVAIVSGFGMGTATLQAHVLGINPGGEVAGVPLLPGYVPPMRYRNRLLNRAEAAEAEAALSPETPDPSWTEDADGYVVAPLDWKGAK